MFKKNDKKGQIFSIDTVVSVVGFFIIFIFLISLWNLYSNRLQENIASEELHLLAFQITDILTRSWGVPNDWEENVSNVSTIGLKLNPGSLDNNKLAAFLSLDYDKTKERFNIERFEYHFRVLDNNGNEMNSTGLQPAGSASQSISVTNFVLIKNETRQILFTLWDE